MSDRSDDKASWVTRVLGVRFDAPPPGGPSEASPVDFPKVLRTWQQALDAVDGQIAALQTVLQVSGDDGLQAIAAFSLNAITADHTAKIQTALLEIGSSDDFQRAAGTAIGLIASFLAYLSTDERVAACDANPFGVAMTLRGTLTPPLEALRAVLQASVA